MQRHVAASAPVRYGIAVLFVTGAIALALLIRPVTLAAGQLSLVAILLTGWICGLRPALVAWALTTVAFVYFFTSPFDSLAIERAEIPRLLIFAMLGLFMATVSAARRRAQDALQRARTELETRVRERTTDLQAHLWLLEGLDRIQRTIQATNDVDQMTSHVLETVVTIVGCDQAWLVSPCDPAAPSWRVAMEHTRLPLTGAVPRGVEQPMEPDVADLFSRVRASNGPVWFGVETDPPLPAEIAKRFGIQTQIAVALYPKDVAPYLFAVSQCSSPRVWTPQEGRLVHEIGLRLADALTTRFTLRRLGDSEAKLEQAQRIARVGYWDHDLDTDRVTWSDETFRIFGLVPGKSALPSAAVFELIHPEDQPAVAAALADVRRGASRLDVECRVVQPGGEVRAVHSHGDAVKGESGRARRIFGVIHDVTDRTRAEEALRASEEQWRAVFENNPTTYFMVDAAGAVVSVNPFGAEQLGYTVDELANQPVLKVYHEADRDAVQASIARCLHQLGQPFSWELRKVRKDGAVRWVRETARAMRRAGGEPVILVASEDITEQREAEEERQERRWVIESMDRVNRAIQGTNDLEQMLSDVLDVVLSLFGCDRAWLLCPYDPKSTTFDSALMERTRPEFPGRFPMGSRAPVDPQSLAVHRIVRESTGPVQFGPGAAQHPLPSELAQRFGVQSRMVMALHPKSAQPHLFGVSQCSHPRVWSPREEFLFQEIGRRLADALTSLLMFRSLRESEERYRSIFDSTGVSIWEEDFSQVKAAIENLRSSGVHDFRGYFDAHPEFVQDAIRMVRIVDVNAASLELFGAESKEELLVSLPKVFAPETRTVFVEELVAIADGRTSFEAEAVVQSLRGARLNVLLTMSLPPSPDRFERVLVTLMDVTARKRAEYFTTHVFESAPDQTSILGLDYRFRRVNPVLERFWRLPSGSGAGRHLADVIGMVEFERVKPALDRCSTGEDASWVGWSDTIRGRRYLAISFTPLRPDREMVEAILAIARDLTDHMLAIEALQKAQAELAHTTRVTTLGELAASIAHEVNQPLAGIVADANASLNWLAAPTPEFERVREGLDAIVEGGHRAAEVLQRVRQLATKTAPNKSPVNVNRVIDDIVPLIRAQVMANEVSLERQLSDAVPAVLADRIQLQQVLINLVMNAIDAMASVTDRPRELIIRSDWHDAGHVKVAVQDSGVGLDPDTVDRLFGAFFTTKPGGMGMGLSISRSIVEGHGGRLWATANERHGAIFHFSLPIAPPP